MELTLLAAFYIRYSAYLLLLVAAVVALHFLVMRQKNKALAQKKKDFLYAITAVVFIVGLIAAVSIPKLLHKPVRLQLSENELIITRLSGTIERHAASQITAISLKEITTKYKKSTSSTRKMTVKTHVVEIRFHETDPLIFSHQDASDLGYTPDALTKLLKKHYTTKNFMDYYNKAKKEHDSTQK